MLQGEENPRFYNATRGRRFKEGEGKSKATQFYAPLNSFLRNIMGVVMIMPFTALIFSPQLSGALISKVDFSYAN